MKLNELLTQKVSLKLARLDRDLFMNMITLDDTAWLMDQYPGEELKKIFTEVRIKDLLRIACRILTDESKAYLGSVKLTEYDERGVGTVLENLTLADKLYKLISDGELMKIINAIMEVREKSQDIITDESDKLQKKSQMMMGRNGRTSTTSSQVNTDLP